MNQLIWTFFGVLPILLLVYVGYLAMKNLLPPRMPKEFWEALEQEQVKRKIEGRKLIDVYEI